MTLNDNVIDYVHRDDPNECGSHAIARNFAPSCHNAYDNEMLSVIEELREAGIVIN